MLNIYFGDLPQNMQTDYIFNTSVYFDNTYKDKWITDSFSKDVIKNVDKSDVVDERTISSPIFGNMSPKRLSGGTKTLMLINFDKKKIFNASTCGDNCAKWILQVAETRKVTVSLRHLMDFGKGNFKIKVLNTGKIVSNMAELVEEAAQFV